MTHQKPCLHTIPKLGFGLGLRAPHLSYIFDHKPAIDWFEIISENYMDTDGKPKRNLERIKEMYPLVMHGVSLSIGTVDPMNSEYLAKLKKLAHWVKPAWISDHLCWTGVAHQNTHDLLPVPYTQEALDHIIKRIKNVQDYLERPLILENPSTYLEFKSSEIAEEDFIAQMAQESGCGLLLDINNIYVSCYNHRKDPKAYIDALPLDRVYQIHLAGHTNKGTHIVDTHDGPVIDEVWQLYKYAISKSGMINTMIEWDDHIPPFDVVNDELAKAREAVKTCHDIKSLPNFKVDMPPYRANAVTPLTQEQMRMKDAIIKGPAINAHPEDWIRYKPEFTQQDQLNVYVSGYRQRLFDVTASDFPVLRTYLGDDRLDYILRDFVNHVPSSSFDAAKYPAQFPAFLRQHPQSDDIAFEISLLENAVAQLYHGPETPALEANHLRSLSPEELMDATLSLRTSLELFSFNHQINDFYSAVINQKTLAVPVQEKSFLAVFRHDDILWRLEIEQDEYALLCDLRAGKKIGDALDALTQKKPDYEDFLEKNFPNWFARWIANGLLTYAPHSFKTQERLSA